VVFGASMCLKNFPADEQSVADWLSIQNGRLARSKFRSRAGFSEALWESEGKLSLWKEEFFDDWSELMNLLRII